MLLGANHREMVWHSILLFVLTYIILTVTVYTVSEAAFVGTPGYESSETSAFD